MEQRASFEDEPLCASERDGVASGGKNVSPRYKGDGGRHSLILETEECNVTMIEHALGRVPLVLENQRF